MRKVFFYFLWVFFSILWEFQVDTNSEIWNLTIYALKLISCKPRGTHAKKMLPGAKHKQQYQQKQRTIIKQFHSIHTQKPFPISDWAMRRARNKIYCLPKS